VTIQGLNYSSPIFGTETLKKNSPSSSRQKKKRKCLGELGMTRHELSYLR
jgi:hypothetical protein